MNLPIKPVILWTDALIYLLLAAVLVAIWLTRKWPHLASPWKRVAQQKSGMAAAVVLSLFLMVGLLDSLHFRPQLPGAQPVYSVELWSVFDLIAENLKQSTEKTYSAPFAAYSYAKETVILPDGAKDRRYPRLKYGAAHLQNPETERLPDIARRAFAGAALAALAWCLVAALLVAAISRKRNQPFIAAAKMLFRGQTTIPWSTMLITFGLCLLIVFPAISLCGHYHILGTDKVGQDMFYLALKSIRTALVIGTLTTLVMLPVSIWLGITAGFFGGWVDDAIQYLYTTLNSIPSVLLIAAAVLMMQVYIDTHPALFETMAERADLRLLFLCIILGMTNWTGLCRLLRGEALKLREMEYILAAQAFGVSKFRIIGRHLLPNVMHIVLISVVMEFSSLVLAEAVLSYVGVGVDPSMKSFGTMINAARLEMAREPMVWWSLAAAFGFMFTLVLSANLAADAVRDAFDPRIGSGNGKGAS